MSPSTSLLLLLLLLSTFVRVFAPDDVAVCVVGVVCWRRRYYISWEMMLLRTSLSSSSCTLFPLSLGAGKEERRLLDR